MTIHNLIITITQSLATDTSIIFTTNGRSRYAFDIFSLPLNTTTITIPNELHLTDGHSVNFNGYFVTPSGDQTLTTLTDPLQTHLVYVIKISLQTESARFLLESTTRGLSDSESKGGLVGGDGKVSMKDRPSLVNGILVYVSTREDTCSAVSSVRVMDGVGLRAGEIKWRGRWVAASARSQFDSATARHQGLRKQFTTVLSVIGDMGCIRIRPSNTVLGRLAQGLRQLLHSGSAGVYYPPMVSAGWDSKLVFTSDRMLQDSEVGVQIICEKNVEWSTGEEKCSLKLFVLVCCPFVLLMMYAKINVGAMVLGSSCYDTRRRDGKSRQELIKTVERIRPVRSGQDSDNYSEKLRVVLVWTILVLSKKTLVDGIGEWEEISTTTEDDYMSSLRSYGPRKDPQTPLVPQDEDEREPIYTGYVTDRNPRGSRRSRENDEIKDDKDDKDEEEEEEHLAPADSAIVVPVDEPVFPPEGTEPRQRLDETSGMTTPSLSLTYLTITTSAGDARLTRNHNPTCTSSPPLCHTFTTIHMVIVQALIAHSLTTQDSIHWALIDNSYLPHSIPHYTLLPPLPPSLYIPPPVDRRDDIPESEISRSYISSGADMELAAGRSYLWGLGLLLRRQYGLVEWKWKPILPRGLAHR
ncbi:hypothetical protein Tco_0738194 [Tanacetum coccineum]